MRSRLLRRTSTISASWASSSTLRPTWTAWKEFRTGSSSRSSPSRSSTRPRTPFSSRFWSEGEPEDSGQATSLPWQNRSSCNSSKNESSSNNSSSNKSSKNESSSNNSSSNKFLRRRPENGKGREQRRQNVFYRRSLRCNGQQPHKRVNLRISRFGRK